MSISKFNKNTKVFTFQAPEGFRYYAMRDLFNTNGPEAVYTILGWFFHTGKFGEQPVFITPKYYINGPKHMCQQCRDIMADAEAVAQINAAQAGFKIRSYKNSAGTTSYSVEWVDIPAENLPY